MTETISHNTTNGDNMQIEQHPASDRFDLANDLQAMLQNFTLQHASEAAAWRAREAELITRDINARKALEEIKAELAAALQRTTAAEGRVILAAPGPSPPPPANAPRKRRRRLASTVADVPPSTGTPTRVVTRSVQRRLTQEALEAAQSIHGQSTIGEPMGIDPGAINEPLAVNFASLPVLQRPPPNPEAPTPSEPILTQRRRADSRVSPGHFSPPSNQPPVVRPSLGPTQTSGLPPSSPALADKRRSRNLVKSAAQLYRFLPRDMPADLEGLKKSLDIHIRILWGLMDAKAVPKDPPPQLLNVFALRFSTEAQLHTSQESGPELISLSLVRIGTMMSSYQGAIARHARVVEENMLAYIQVRLARFGFHVWCPDLRQTPYSLYNCACRIVTLDTFKQALVSNTYEHLAPNLHHAQNMDLLARLYDHFVHYYMYTRYKKEVHIPGRVEQDLKLPAVYQNRQRLADARLKFLEENGYPKRYCDLIDAKATSDDELDPVSSVYLIKRRPERSVEAERFFRILDVKRQEYCQQQKSRKWRERARIVPATGQTESRFKVLPHGMPIDYFDPTYFNQLQPMMRNRIAVPEISLLPNVEDSLSWCSDERLRDVTFTRKYGRVVLDRYNLVMDSDLFNISHAESGDEHDEDDGSEGDGVWIDEDEPRSEDQSFDEGESGSGSDMSILERPYLASSLTPPTSGLFLRPEDRTAAFNPAGVGAGEHMNSDSVTIAPTQSPTPSQIV